MPSEIPEDERVVRAALLELIREAAHASSSAEIPLTHVQAIAAFALICISNDAPLSEVELELLDNG